jgi:hypothetical protein
LIVPVLHGLIEQTQNQHQCCMHDQALKCNERQLAAPAQRSASSALTMPLLCR